MGFLRLWMAISLLLTVTAGASAQIRTVDRAVRDSLANTPTAAGAEQVVKFETERFDFGTLCDADEPQMHEYRFRNTGSEPLVITRLATTCGCATAKAGQNPVPAGGEGSIAVTYNPRGHIGRFSHRVFVYTQLSDSQPTAILRLSVTVNPEGYAEDGYAFGAGALRMSERRVHFSPDASAAAEITVFNAGDKALTIGCRQELLPPCIEFECRPRTVEPQGEAVLTIKFDAGLMPEERRRLYVPLMLTGTGVSGLQSTINIAIDNEE